MVTIRMNSRKSTAPKGHVILTQSFAVALASVFHYHGVVTEKKIVMKGRTNLTHVPIQKNTSVSPLTSGVILIVVFPLGGVVIMRTTVVIIPTRSTVNHGIRKNLLCNGEYNCQDHSDEQNCNHTCTSQDFQCENPPFCIFAGWRCDGDADCVDGSDERNCENRTLCHPDQFKCLNGECLSLSWRCDGERDCADGSDEDTEMCKSTPCESGKFRYVIWIMHLRAC